MTDKEVLLMLLEHIEGRYTYIVDSYPSKYNVSHRVYVEEEGYPGITFYFEKDDDSLMYVSEFETQDEKLLDLDEAKALMEEFEKEDTPFETILPAEGHSGLNLYGSVSYNALTTKLVDKLLDYLSHPSKYLERLINITKGNDKETIK